MTKRVRIENADNSSFKLTVEVWDKKTDGPDVLHSTHDLLYPTDIKELTIWSDRYLIIKEKAKE